MDAIRVCVFLLCSLLGASSSVNADAISKDVVNAKVERTIDLSTHLAKMSSVVTLQNKGSSAVNSFLFTVDDQIHEHVSFVGAVIKGTEDQKLKVTETTVTGKKFAFYRIDLKSALAAGQTVTVTVDVIATHALKPYPAQVTQAEKQFVQFLGNAHYLSPYKTTTQTTTFKVTSSAIESYTKTVKPVQAADATITYGPFEAVEAFSEAPVTIHYENNTPFLTVTHLTRVIEVSHWGNIAVEETLDLFHSGATLKGAFSRYDYQRQQDAHSSIKSFKTILPAAARDIYYRDEIGNISTSHLKENSDSVELELRPRFPLFGGWKTHYYIGYNVPSYQYLYNRGDNYVLKMRFLDHVFDDQVVDEMTVKVILPEGAKTPAFSTPYSIKRAANEVHKTYLDTFGRPVIIAHKSNLVEQHIQDFELKYSFQKVLLLQEPLLLVGAFYLLFIVVIIYVRLDFSITKDEASESRMRVASLMEQVQGLQDRRSACYQSYDDAINKYKSSKDSAAFNANRKKVDADHKTLTAQIASILSKLKTEGSDTLEKVQELQRLDVQVRDQVNQAVQHAEKLIGGKMTKPQYLDFESTVQGKREELYGKMETILTTL